MPQTIYMPQDPTAIGNIMSPIADQFSGFMYRHIAERSRQKFQERMLEKKYELDKEREESAGPKLPYTPGTVKKFPHGEKDFEFGVFTGTPQQFPNMPPGWESTGIKGKRTSAISLTVPEKLDYHKGKAEITSEQQLAVDAAKRDRENKQKVRDVKFPSMVEALVAKRHGISDWRDLDPYVKEESIFNEMDRLVKEVYPNAIYDDKREAWYDLKTKKLIRKYIQRTKLFHRGDKRR